MILARVIGSSVATVHHRSYDGRKVLICEALQTTGEPTGKTFLAIDAVQAGAGDCVLAAREGNTARQILGDPDGPLHAVILAIVDEVHLEDAPA
jgi:microcompartment protein CcmK/EutM